MAAVTDAELEQLRHWFVSNGGTIHPDLHLTCSHPSSHVRGSHLRVSPRGVGTTELLSVPFGLTLSILNIPAVAPFWPLSFLSQFAAEPQVLARFLLVEAWLQGHRGFWWRYLRAVPQPPQQSNETLEYKGSDPFDTPLYWTAEERQWLRGTRLGAVADSREQKWRSEHAAGKSYFQENALSADQVGKWQDAQATRWEGYSWELYKWAATVLSSRSFSSYALEGWWPEPLETAALREEKLGSELARTIDSSTFPVLFPVLDTANHDPDTSAYWRRSGSSCLLESHASFAPNSELCINYDANGNDMLLMGYGFMLENNRYDRVHLSARSEILQHDGRESPTKAGEGLMPAAQLESVEQLCSVLLSALTPAQTVQLMQQLANDRERDVVMDLGLPNRSLEDLPGLLARPDLRRIIGIVTDKVLLGLQSYRERLRSDMPSELGESPRLKMAVLFRQGQVNILDSNMRLLQDFLGNSFIDTETISIADILGEGRPSGHKDLLCGLLETACGIEPNERAVWENGLHELVFTIGICLTWLKRSGDPKHSPLGTWLNALETSYGDPRTLNRSGARQDENESGSDEDTAVARSYLEVIRYASETMPQEAVFSQSAWTVEFILWGLSIFRQESVTLEFQNSSARTTNANEPQDMLFWPNGC